MAVGRPPRPEKATTPWAIKWWRPEGSELAHDAHDVFDVPDLLDAAAGEPHEVMALE
ncbi:MAG TPA: hypothetical protein VHM89_09770 [Acidimicrobiales bacterium]|nr:hypothetical protein [Acidimicrobiales bacterium]